MCSQKKISTPFNTVTRDSTTYMEVLWDKLDECRKTGNSTREAALKALILKEIFRKMLEDYHKDSGYIN